VKAVDQLLSDFNYQLFEKHQLLELLKNGFGREFGMNKPLKLQLDKKFRQERSHINRLMKGDNEFKPIYKIINEKSERIESIVAQIFSLNVKNELERPLNDLMSSYIHMMCNRLFKSKQRLHELVVYDFMERFYKSEIAKLKYQNTESPKQRVNS
jgi:thiopeptide-type bacteriocin biosynthesis protein